MTEVKPETKKGRSFSGVWVIPVVALLLGAYMVVHTFMTEGPEITLSFKDGDGLVAGKTKVRLRNVDLGTVQEIVLNDDMSGVVATIKLEREVIPLLREDTRFWVVRARIGAGSISGLGTLLSGAYIEISPGNGAQGKRAFVGLEEPPLTPLDAPGLRLQLHAPKASSVSAGDAVLFRGYKVGRVESMRFDVETQRIMYGLFVDAPFHNLVTSTTRFWDVSGVTIDAGADGVNISTGSLETILLGGVTFEIPPGFEKGAAVENKTEFRLFQSYDEVVSNPYDKGVYLVTSFAQSLKGLTPGAPVEYRGIPLGRVVRIMVSEMVGHGMDSGSTGEGNPIPVLLYLEPGRLTLSDDAAGVEQMKQTIIQGVANGLRTQLATGNLLTGSRYISMEYYPEDEKKEIFKRYGYPVIPSIGGGLDRIEQRVFALLDKFNEMPLNETVTGVNEAIGELKATLASVNSLLDNSGTQALPGELQGTLEQLQQVLKGFSPTSELYRNLDGSLNDLNRTMQNIESLTRSLSDQPNGLVMPLGLPSDPIPEAK